MENRVDQLFALKQLVISWDQTVLGKGKKEIHNIEQTLDTQNL